MGDHARRVVQGDQRTISGAGPTDAALVIAALGGEEWGFDALFYRYAKYANRLARRLLVGVGEADDVVQEAFTALFTNLRELKQPDSVPAWLRTTIVRKASNRIRSHRLRLRFGLATRADVNLDGFIASSAPPDVVSELRNVYSMIEHLSSEQRMVLLLSRVEGLELAEIASTLRMSVSTVQRRLREADAELVRRRGT